MATLGGHQRLTFGNWFDKEIIMRGLRFWGLGCIGLAVFVFVSPVRAQNPIQWIDSLERGRNIAQRTQRPLLLYMPGGGDAEESDVEEAQDKSFRDVTVRGFVRQRFVPVRLARSRAHQRMLSELGLPAGVGLFLVAATPDGEFIGKVNPIVVGDAPRLVDALVQLFRRYRRELFNKELKPELTGERLSDSDARRALDVVQRFLIAQADETVAKLLERSALRDRVRQEAYETLSTLSTKVCVDALVKAAQDDEDARRELAQCTPAGAEYMLDALVSAGGQIRHDIYEAIVDICDIEDPKMRVFWKNADDKQRQKALQQIKERVRERARAWRRQYAHLR